MPTAAVEKPVAKGPLTDEEREKILNEAYRLIKEPANWITGDWKCPIYEVDPKTKKVLLDDKNKPIPVCDKLNRPLAQYCIEGAVNQASVNVLGMRRAVGHGYSISGSKMTDKLGLNDLAMELYGRDSALELNDDDGQGKRTHKKILNLITTGLNRLKEGAI